jgi:hypothetical protein
MLPKGGGLTSGDGGRHTPHFRAAMFDTARRITSHRSSNHTTEFSRVMISLGVKRNPEGIGDSFKLLCRQIVVRPGLPNVPEFSTEQIIDH